MSRQVKFAGSFPLVARDEPLSWRMMTHVRPDLPSGTVTFLFTDVEGISVTSVEVV